MSGGGCGREGLEFERTKEEEEEDGDGGGDWCVWAVWVLVMFIEVKQDSKANLFEWSMRIVSRDEV